MFLFDTDVLSEITSRRPDAPLLHKLMACAPDLRFASEITRYELRYGSALLPPGSTMWARVEADVLPRCTWLPVDAAVGMHAADLGATLRLAGKTIDPADLFIAATALAHDLIVVTRNVRHVDRIEGFRSRTGFRPNKARQTFQPWRAARDKPATSAMPNSAT